VAGLRIAAIVVSLAGLAGCVAPTPDVAPPTAAPESVDTPPKRPEAAAPSAESRALAERYARIESDLRARGLLRTDGGGPDAPFDAETLTRNFVRIALYDEFTPVAGRLVARETTSKLRRWEDPVRITPVFGPSVGAAQRETDRATVAALTGRLAEASGHDIATAANGGNMTVFVVSEDERRALAPRLRQEVPGISRELVRTIVDLPPSTFCLMVAFSTDQAPHTYTRAVGVVRAEHPSLLRRSCFHEEIAQGLGLANDSPDARPSIFNDDEEFALLTDHDALLLAILYDDRLAPGMTAREALPIIREIARELAPEAASPAATPVRAEGGPFPGAEG